MNTPVHPATGRPARRAVLARWLLALAWLLLAAAGTPAADALDVIRMPDVKVRTHRQVTLADSSLPMKDATDNVILPGCAYGQHVFFLDIDAALTNADGTLPREVVPDLLHPDEKGDEIWTARREPTLLQLPAQP